MRVTSVGTVVRRFADSLSYAGVSTPFIDQNQSFAISTLNRADVTINKDDGTGWRKPSPYEVTLTALERGSCNIVLDNKANRRYFRNIGAINPNGSTPAFSISKDYLETVLPKSSDIDVAVIKARNNVADRVASFGESLAELTKTLSSLGALAGGISEFITAVEKKDYRKVADSLGIPRKSRKHRRAVMRYNKLGIPTISNAFLCWSFGLKPIINDMVSLCILMGQGKPLRVVGKAFYPIKGSPTLHSTPCAVSYAGPAYTVHQKQVKKAGTYVRLDYQVSLEALRNLTSYGLLDAPATVWAVMPYSFLVDFVLPVSEVLRSLTATYGLNFKGGSATRFVRVERKYSHATPPANTADLKTKTFQVDVDDMLGLRMVRSVFKADPNPVTLYIKDPVSAFTVSTVFSLLGQKLGKARYT